MRFIHNDGGRAAAGYKGSADDCVVRAVAIATQQDYATVYDALSEGCRTQRLTKRSRRKASARGGVNVRRRWFTDYMTSRGWECAKQQHPQGDNMSDLLYQDDIKSDLDTLEPSNKDFRGKLVGKAAVRQFISAGNATITTVSRNTGARFTFKFQRPKPKQAGEPMPEFPIFCKVLTGQDNENAYTFVGTLWPEDTRLTYRHSPKSAVNMNAPSVLALRWLVSALDKPEEVLDQCEVYHEGRCGRCGRKLTVPESITTGYGPECVSLINR